MSKLTVTSMKCHNVGFPVISIDHLIQQYEPGLNAR